MTSQRTTPHSESKFTQQAILSGICDNKDLDKAWDKKKGSLYKCSKLLPNFPGSQCRTQPDILENRWERVYGIQATLNCLDTMLAFMIKETANRDSELYQTLEHLKHTDGCLLQQGLEGVKKLITEDVEECRGGSGSVEECQGVSRSVEECRGVSSGVEDCRGVSRSVEECRGVPRSAEERGVSRSAVECRESNSVQECRGVSRSVEEC